MKKFATALLAATLFSAGIGTAFAAPMGMNAAPQPMGTIAACSSPGDTSNAWDTAKAQLSELLNQDGVKFSSIDNAVGCLQVAVVDKHGDQSFQYYDPNSLVRVR